MSDLKLSPLVIKLGGAALDCAETLSKLFGAIANIRTKPTTHRDRAWRWLSGR